MADFEAAIETVRDALDDMDDCVVDATLTDAAELSTLIVRLMEIVQQIVETAKVKVDLDA